MELTDFSKGSIWGILPDKFDILSRKYIEIGIDIESRLDEEFGAEGETKPPYRVIDGIAIIDIEGPLSKRSSFFSFLFGGTSYAQIAGEFSAAMADESVNGIVLNIDSPGGVVSGTEGLSNIIYQARGEKPIIAFTDGVMASAAYWVGSAADAIIATETAVTGSIGVLMIHRDFSEMDKKDGIKTSYLTAGKYKAMGNDSEPLTKEAREMFQDQLDYIYSIFVDNVALNREVESSKVLADMADGQVFIGNQGKDAGLVDHVGNFDLALQLAISAVTDNNNSNQSEVNIMNSQELNEKHPDLVLEIHTAAIEAARGKIKHEVAEAEQNKLIELIGIQFGEDQKEEFAKLVKSGVTPEQFKAVKALQKDPEPESKEDDVKAEILKGISDTGAENPGADNNVMAGKDYMQLVNEYMLQNKCSRVDAMRAVNVMKPNAQKEYIKKVNQG